MTQERVRDLVGYGPNPPHVRWPGDARAAVSFCINYEEGSEYSTESGDGRNEELGEIPYALSPEYPDLTVQSIYEYGSRAGNWRLMRLFDEYEIKVTYFACAVALERNPAVGEWIRRSEHEACSHGYRWEEHWLLDEETERERIAQAVASIERTCGARPLGWYCRYGPSTRTRRLLVEEGGFLYDSDAYNDDLPYFVAVGEKRHLVVPYTLTYNDIRYVLAQGYSSPSDFFDTCKRGLDELRREGAAGFPKMMSIGLHGRWAGQAGRVSALREFIEYALGTGDVWFPRRMDVARWWMDHSGDFAG